MRGDDRLSAAEALYGFAAWLTTREEEMVMGANNDCAPIADAVKEFCEANDLDDPEEGWEEILKLPDPSMGG